MVVGDGLGNYVDDFTSMQSYYLESDFAAGDYDAGVLATFDAFIGWFADFYGVRSGRATSLPYRRLTPAAAIIRRAPAISRPLPGPCWSIC